MLGERVARPPNPTAAYWLIVDRKAGRSRALTLRLAGDREALPVFSSEEEALTFLYLGGLWEGWEVEETVARKLLSRTGAGWVALDPIPEIGDEALVGLVSLSRHSFAELHLGGENPEPSSGIVPPASRTPRPGADRTTRQRRP